MLIGRFLIIVPMLAVAGSLAPRRSCRPRPAPSRPTAPLFVGLLVGVILIVGGLTFFPALALGPIVEHFAMNCRHALLIQVTTSWTSRNRQRGAQSTMLDPAILVPAIWQSVRKLDPRTMIRNPVMFVVEVVATLTTILFLRDLAHRRRRISASLPDHLWLWFTVLFANFAEAVAEGRGKAQAATLRHTRTETMAKRLRDRWRRRAIETVRRTRSQAGRPRAGRGGRPDPERRRGGRGRRLGRRRRHHRRIRAGDPRERRRPLGGDRRHPRAVRLDQGADHRRPGLDLPRPHDRAGRRRRAAEDAQRDRAQHPAGRPDDHLRLRGGDHPELRRLCRRRDLACVVLVALFVDPDPHHHRRAAVGHRHRRHGPAGALQRAGHVGPRGGGGGRRGHAAAGQDRHHHAGQPPGDRVPAARRRDRAASWPTRRSSPRCPTRRRRAAPSWCWRRRNTASAAATWRRWARDSCRSRRRPGISGIDIDGSSIRKGAVDAVLAYVRGGRGLPGRRRRRGAGVRSADAVATRTDRDRRADRQEPAARRWRWPRTAGCWASST